MPRCGCGCTTQDCKSDLLACALEAYAQAAECGLGAYCSKVEVVTRTYTNCLGDSEYTEEVLLLEPNPKILPTAPALYSGPEGTYADGFRTIVVPMIYTKEQLGKEHFTNDTHSNVDRFYRVDGQEYVQSREIVCTKSIFWRFELRRRHGFIRPPGGGI